VVGREREAVLPAAREDRLEALGLQELRGDVVGVLDLADPQRLHDVGVLQLGRELDLVHEGLHALGMGRQLRPDAEDGDQLLEAGIAELGGAVLGAQARRLDLLQQHELAELLPLPHERRKKYHARHGP
jgi:hypothetical protein